jgi:hypothetical protein
VVLDDLYCGSAEGDVEGVIEAEYRVLSVIVFF